MYRSSSLAQKDRIMNRGPPFYITYKWSLKLRNDKNTQFLEPRHTPLHQNGNGNTCA